MIRVLTKHHYIAIASALVLLGILLFGFDTKPEKQKLIEKSRAENFESTSIDLLLAKALEKLPAEDRLYFEKKMQIIGNPDSASIDQLMELSGEWYQKNEYVMAGHYAEIIAEKQNSEEAWSIAGTTYAMGINAYDSEKERAFSGEKAIQALQNAISLNPENLAHQVNLAVCYADFPPEDNPMKGIQMLLDINKEFPENASALFALGRLAIKTGQYDRAKIRLEKVVKLLPDNKKAYCLLVQVYENTGELNKAKDALESCQKK